MYMENVQEVHLFLMQTLILSNFSIYLYDEVYQAALSAGSGGIRWNSTNNMIQLMDQNKNWVNWRFFDANSSFAFVGYRAASNSYTFTVDKAGLYIGGIAFWGTNANMSTTSDSTVLFSSITGSASGYVAYSNCNIGDTITLSCSTGSSIVGYTRIALFYFGSSYTKATYVQSSNPGDNYGSSLSVPSSTKHVLFGLHGGAGPSLTNFQCSTTSKYSGSDYACGTTLYESGSMSISFNGTSYGNGFIVDLQLS